MSLDKVAAIDSLFITIYDCFRDTEEAEDGGEAQYSIGTMLPMKKEADAPADVVDFSTWSLVDSHLREELNLEADPTKLEFQLNCSLKLPNVANPILLKIHNQSTIGLLRTVLGRMDLEALQAIGTIELYAQPKATFKAYKAPPKRTGKNAAEEKATRELSAHLYGAESHGYQHQEAEWTEDCDYFMAKHPARTRSELKPAPLHRLT